MSVSKKKSPTKIATSKGIKLLYDAALLEEARLKRALRRSKRKATSHQLGGSSEGDNFESEVPNEPKGKSVDTSKGTGLKSGVPDVSTVDSSESESESWGDSGNEADEQENIDHKKQEKIYYPRFTKVTIHHIITKDKSISMRNRMFMHTARDDSILGTIRFVSKSEDFQIYGVVLPNRMTNQQIWDFDAYKTYLVYATSATSHKMKRRLKKSSFPSKKRTFAIVEEKEPEPAKKDKPTKKPATKRQSSRV
nr:hypothetical protein [Tanacetum cinerariifolium]